MTSVEEVIKQKLQQVFSPSLLNIENESHMHSGPATDSHFKLILVSESFAGQRLVARHQSVYRALSDELSGPVHARSLHVFPPDEWQEKQVEIPASPQCQGGSRHA